MTDLIQSEISALESVKTLDFPEFKDRAYYKKLPEELRKEIISEAEKVNGFAYITLADYREFKKSGDRSKFESLYFPKRKALSDLVIAELAEDKGRFIPMIEEGVWALLAEPAWVIPAHNCYIRDTEQLDTPLLERPVLDLFACETGEILALTSYLLEDKLSPILVKDIRFALAERIVKPYTEDHFWWMGGEGELNNWTPWCVQNVLLSSLLLPSLDNETKLKIVRQSAVSLDSFIDTYGDDGVCQEGASYYHAAALALFGALLVLERASGRDFQSVFENKKIKAMAGYIEEVHIAGDLYLNYADCSPKAGVLTGREFLFARATGNDAMAHHAAKDYMKYGFRESDNSYNLFYMLLGLSCYFEVEKESEKLVDAKRKPFSYFENSGLVIFREDDIVLSVKGGSNGESHNHNDAGSLILYKGETPLLIDIGVETYTKTTFGPDRYTLKPMRSVYHNLVNFPPLEQMAGPEFSAVTLEASVDTAYFDLRGAYPESCSLKSYRRRVTLDRKKKKILVSEEFEAGRASLSIMTEEEPRINGSKIEFNDFMITFPSSYETNVERMRITDKRLKKAWKDSLYKTEVALPSSLIWEIEIKE